MAGLRDILDRFRYRFRPAAAPGAAAPGAAPPVDRTAELSAEVTPLFVLLADTEEDMRRIRGEAGCHAGLLREKASARARAMLDDAWRRAGPVRAGTAARIRAEAEAEARALVAGAEREALVLRRRAGARARELADRTVAEVAAQLRGRGGGPSPAAPGGTPAAGPGAGWP